MNYSERTKRGPDFRIRYEWRRETAQMPLQHMRCDFAYSGEHERQAYMIWPEFETAEHVPIAEAVTPPRVGTATMWILDDKMRPFHRDRITLGVGGHLVRGSEVIADVEVVEILGLK